MVQDGYSMMKTHENCQLSGGHRVSHMAESTSGASSRLASACGVSTSTWRHAFQAQDRACTANSGSLVRLGGLSSLFRSSQRDMRLANLGKSRQNSSKSHANGWMPWATGLRHGLRG